MSAIKRNLDDIIRKKLTEEIIAGEWVTGSLISIDDIMKRYGVSRTPVIQALKKMDAEGMVEFSSRGHFYVPDYEVKDVKDIVDVRTVLEEYAIRTIQEKGLEIDIIKLREISDEGLRSSADGDVIRVRECDLSFHRTGGKRLSDGSLQTNAGKVYDGQLSDRSPYSTAAGCGECGSCPSDCLPRAERL